MSVVLETERLLIRNWQAGDEPVFHRLNNDEDVMRFYFFRTTREEADAKMREWRERYGERSFGFGAIVLKETGQIIGMSGIAVAPDSVPHGDARLEIGWRFLPEAWGNGYATESALAWLAHAFDVLKEPAICAFAVTNNHPSIAVMKRLGMTEISESPFDHPAVPDTYPHLRPHVLYRITQREWSGGTTLATP